ncbi:DUF6238 family protein [Streptomyces sp. 4N509B]|uniref:DUF6238 family protein n=1 Tax=Streptomyces sp. 4N509B TaxID=3457413 RepID=UPI003FD3800C
MPPDLAPDTAHLQAATAQLRRHHHSARSQIGPASRAELDWLHAHLVALHTVVDQVQQRTHAEGALAEAAHLAATRTRVWQATAHLHDAFHAAPGPTPTPEVCPVDQPQLPPGPARETLCHRHLMASTVVRRQTTPAELHDPLHGHTHHPPDTPTA